MVSVIKNTLRLLLYPLMEKRDATCRAVDATRRREDETPTDQTRRDARNRRYDTITRKYKLIFRLKRNTGSKEKVSSAKIRRVLSRLARFSKEKFDW